MCVFVRIPTFAADVVVDDDDDHDVLVVVCVLITHLTQVSYINVTAILCHTNESVY